MEVIYLGGTYTRRIGTRTNKYRLICTRSLALTGRYSFLGFTPHDRRFILLEGMTRCRNQSHTPNPALQRDTLTTYPSGYNGVRNHAHSPIQYRQFSFLLANSSGDSGLPNGLDTVNFPFHVH